MEPLTKNQKIIGVSLAGVIAWLMFRNKVQLQSHRAETPAGPVQVVVPVPTNAGTGAIANVLGNILPTAHTELVGRALGQTPMVIQQGRMAPTRVGTIADVQHALNFLKVCGTTPLKDSGVLDAPTVACLKAFQSLMQIPVTGLNDPTTMMTLESAITKAAISTAAPGILSQPQVASPPTINPQIATERDLQRALNLLGASPKLKEDGKIGPITTAAIKAFQVVHGMLADGLAGPQTKAAVAAAVTTPPPAPVVAPPAPAVHGAFGFGLTTADGFRRGDFGYGPPPPPVEGLGIPGFNLGGGYVPVTPPAPPHPPAPHEEYRGRPGAPRPDAAGFYRGRSADGTPYMKSWERWQEVKRGTADNTWTHYTQWRDGVGQDPRAEINGDFGVPHAAMRHGGGGGGFRGRGGMFALGLPYDEEVVEVVDTVDDDGNPVVFNGEEIREMEERAMHNARHAAHEAMARGDRRFEHPEIGPQAPPMPGERYRNEGRVEHHGFFHHLRRWLGFERSERRIDENPYIPPPATPQQVNWDPFATSTYYTLDTVERWYPDDLRRREEIERRGFRPEAPIVPGRPAAPIMDHATPPAPPAPHPAGPLPPNPLTGLDTAHPLPPKAQ